MKRIIVTIVLISVLFIAVAFGIISKFSTVETTLEIKNIERITAPIFSLTDYFYDTDMTLELTYTDDYGTYEIYYTTDGTTPTEKSKLYTEPIEIECTRRIVNYPFKARVLHEDGSWSDVTHHTYFVGKFVKIDRFNTLVISLSTDPYNLYDYVYGILIEGYLREEWVYYHPNEEVIPPSPANYNLRGRQSERPVYVEIFNADGERVINQDGGVRVYGGWSRATKLKSLKIYARNEYDNVNWFNYKFFGEDYNANGEQITRYKRFVVRNAGNDHGSAYIRDELFETLARDAGFPDTERVAPVSVFVNGEYFGCYWLHDVYCDGYFQERYGKHTGKFVVLGIAEKHRDANEDDEQEQEASADYDAMYSYAYKDLTDDNIYAKLCELLDVENYMMYCVINTYIDNNDWPHNNNRAYRYFAADGEEYRNEFPFDGKWRFMTHDMDYSSGLYGLSHNTNTVKNILNRDKSPMLMALMKRDDCKEFFVKYMLDLLNGAFGEENFVSTLSKMHASRALEMDNFLSTSKYAPNMSMVNVTSSIKTLKEFAANRPSAMIRNLRTTFSLSDTYTININNSKNCGITVNTYTTYKDEFNGTYILDYPTKIQAVITNDAEFSHWLINGRVVSDEIITVQEDVEISLVLK